MRGRRLPRPHAVPRPAQRPPPVRGRPALPPRRARAPGGGVRSRHRRRTARCRRGAPLPRHRHPLRRAERARPGRLRPPPRPTAGVVPFARRCRCLLPLPWRIRPRSRPTSPSAGGRRARSCGPSPGPASCGPACGSSPTASNSCFAASVGLYRSWFLGHFASGNHAARSGAWQERLADGCRGAVAVALDQPGLVVAVFEREQRES